MVEKYNENIIENKLKNHHFNDDQKLENYSTSICLLYNQKLLKISISSKNSLRL